MESKKVDLDSSFHAVDFGLKKKNSSLCQWKLYSGFQSLVRFRIPWVVFQANISQIAGKSGLPHMRRNFKSCLVLTYIITCVQITAQIKVVVIRELKQQTFAIHGGQPELKLHKSCALRMSHGRRGLSRRAPMNFSRPCRFVTILILHGFLRRQR